MYFEMKVQAGKKNGVIKWPNLSEGVRAFQWGEKIDVKVPEPIQFLVDFTRENPPTDFASDFMPILSDRLIGAFQNAGVQNMQTFKAILVNPFTGESWDNYKVVNVTKKISCADLASSDYIELFKPSLIFMNLLISETKAQGALLFRLEESLDKILVHKDVLSYMYTKNNEPVFEGVEFDAVKSTLEIND